MADYLRGWNVKMMGDNGWKWPLVGCTVEPLRVSGVPGQGLVAGLQGTMVAQWMGGGRLITHMIQIIWKVRTEEVSLSDGCLTKLMTNSSIVLLIKECCNSGIMCNGEDMGICDEVRSTVACVCV